MLKGWKEDPLNKRTVEDLLDDYIKLYNDCISEAPEDMHIGLHICRGIFNVSRVASPSLIERRQFRQLSSLLRGWL